MAAPYEKPVANIQIGGAPGSRTFTLVEGSLDPQGDPIDGVQTVYKEAYKLRRTIRENDPNSAEWEAEARAGVEFSRTYWRAGRP